MQFTFTARLIRDFVTMSTLGNSDLIEVKESTKDVFRRGYFFFLIDRLCFEFENCFMNTLPLLESICIRC